MFFFYYPWIFRLLFPNRVWRKKTERKVIYLTFDDGPIPKVTEWVLDELKNYDAKATFFCVGDNIRKYPSIYERLLSENHRSANHTFNHLNGSSTTLDKYLQNVEECSKYLKLVKDEKVLFRPPYGRLTFRQAKELRKRNYEIIMWEVLSADFSPKVSAEKCLQKSIKYTRSGSIIVFHDSLKTIEKLNYVLPQYLAHFHRQGYSFEVLPN
ncbi:MAG: polysaccharide deacetylase family protein [Cytophagales bacterium]|nr:polysaccharide deacetylase family protein [Cytophagales bacterium]